MRFTSPGLLLAIAGCFLLMFGYPGVGLGQEITFDFDVSQDGVTYATHMFGLRADAQPGLDSHDIPAPPPVPEAPFRSYLAMFDPPAGLPNQWLHDLRPLESLANDRVELWQMDLTSEAIGGSCTITISENQPGQAPYELNFFGPGADFQNIAFPGSFSFPVSDHYLVFFWELNLTDEVDVLNQTWGGVKSLYH